LKVLLRKQFPNPAASLGGTLRMGFGRFPEFFPEKKGNPKTYRIIQPIQKLVNLPRAISLDGRRPGKNEEAERGSHWDRVRCFPASRGFRRCGFGACGMHAGKSPSSLQRFLRSLNGGGMKSGEMGMKIRLREKKPRESGARGDAVGFLQSEESYLISPLLPIFSPSGAS
jgi:hypothetical protein